MYEYNEESNPIDMACELLPNIEIKQDKLPILHPYVPRLCKHRGYFLIWYGSSETDPDIAVHSVNAKLEPQWISCDDNNKIEKAVALIYPYDDEVIIGTVKYPGYIKTRSKAERTKLLKSVWKDIIKMFGNKKIICPTGTYFDHLHLVMNEKRAPHEAYHKRLMMSNGFNRHEEYWIRDANLLA